VSSAAEILIDHKQEVPQPAATPIAPDSDLPEQVIERKPGWQLLDFKELWRYRELLFFLAWRDVKIRYKQTVLGAAWAILQPVAMMIVFTFFLGRLAALPSKDGSYSLFVLAGLVPWAFLATAVSSAGQSIVSGQSLVTKVYFPRLIIPMGAVGASLVDFGLAFGILFLMQLAFGVFPGSGFLLVPLVLLGFIVLAMGIGIFLSALTVAYRDFRFIVPFLIQLWMFATPSIYMETDAVLHPQWHAVLPFNPAFGLIASFRDAVLGSSIDYYALAVSSLVSLLVLVLGCLYFRKVERSFADII
jgi:lipopolysaccharide transport system permease protein